MKTEIETVGFGGGFTDARSNAAARRAVPLVQVRARQGSYLGHEKKDARPKRWGIYAIAVGSVTGIIPLAAAELVADAFTGVLIALESLIGSGTMAALGIGLCIAAIIACMAYLFRLVER